MPLQIVDSKELRREGHSLLEGRGERLGGRVGYPNLFTRLSIRERLCGSCYFTGAGPRLSRELGNLFLYLYGLADAEVDAGAEAGDNVGGPGVVGAGETGAAVELE